jgi:hypothetical protein
MRPEQNLENHRFPAPDPPQYVPAGGFQPDWCAVQQMMPFRLLFVPEIAHIPTPF